MNKEWCEIWYEFHKCYKLKRRNLLMNLGCCICIAMMLVNFIDIMKSSGDKFSYLELARVSLFPIIWIAFINSCSKVISVLKSPYLLDWLVDDVIVVVMAIFGIFILKTIYPLVGGNDTYLMLAYNPIFIICCINLVILNLPCKGWNQIYPIKS